MKLGVLDWGIGGIGFYKEYKRNHPEASIVYLSDAGFTPYGKVDEGTLRERILFIHNWFKEQGCSHVMIACNAASTVIYNHHLPKVYNIIESGLSTVRKSKINEIAIIGGQRTVDSSLYKKHLPKLNVNEVVAQPISALIETGDISSAVLESEIEKILNQINESFVLLACTHYPAALDVFKKVDSTKEYLDPVIEAVNSLEFNSVENGNSNDIFYTTGVIEDMINGAFLAFGVQLQGVISIDVKDLKKY